MHIIIDEIHRRIHLYSSGQQPVARPGAELQAWWAGTDARQARSFVDRYFRDAGRLHMLRHALTLNGHDRFDLAQRSDDDVLQAAARRLSGGAWRIVCEVAAAAGVVRSVPAPATSPLLGGSGSGGSARTSRRRAPPVSSAPAPATVPAAPGPTVVPDWPNGEAQVAQAETLERAARDGTPFCEICEARRRAAEEAAA
jgi:hypothetical protein